MEKKRKIFIGILIIIAIIFILYGLPNDIYEDIYSGDFDDGETSIISGEAINWRDIMLVDTLTNQEYKISDFSNEVVIIETFAVWCPTCRKQQQEIKKLQESGDNSIHISLDVDPNEDFEKIKEHAQINEFDWIFSISPVSLTKGLIDEFGTTIVNAPQAPTILICPNGEARLLKNGVKKANELTQEIVTC
jgi:thiol-disulfide isomerase/thioredoxin